jgi:MFS family permease
MGNPVDKSGARNVRVFGLTSLLNDTASEMAYWVLPAFLVSIGAGPAQLGIIEGIAESVASFVKLFSGVVADRFPRRKPLVVLGYLVANAAKPLLALTSSWWHVLAIRFADRFSKGMRGTPRDVMVADSVARSSIGSAYGFIQAMDSAGAIAGPLLALWLMPSYGMRGIFWFAAIPGLLCVLAAQFGIREPKVEDRRQFSASQALIGWRNFPRGFYAVLLAVTLFSLGNSSDMFLVLRAEDVGISPAQAPLMGLAFNTVYTLCSWPAGKISDRVSRRMLAASGYVVFAMVYFVFAAAPSRMAIWIAMSGYGLFYALTNPVLKALIVDAVDEDSRGRALGLYYFTTSIAILVASLITGSLWKYFGPQVPFFVSAATALVAAILLLLAPSTRRA